MVTICQMHGYLLDYLVACYLHLTYAQSSRNRELAFFFFFFNIFYCLIIVFTWFITRKMYTSVILKGNIKKYTAKFTNCVQVTWMNFEMVCTESIFFITQVTPLIGSLLVTKNVQRQTQHLSQGRADHPNKGKSNIIYYIAKNATSKMLHNLFKNRKNKHCMAI